jgi:hypothetical protein
MLAALDKTSKKIVVFYERSKISHEYLLAEYY